MTQLDVQSSLHRPLDGQRIENAVIAYPAVRMFINEIGDVVFRSNVPGIPGHLVHVVIPRARLEHVIDRLCAMQTEINETFREE